MSVGNDMIVGAYIGGPASVVGAFAGYYVASFADASTAEMTQVFVTSGVCALSFAGASGATLLRDFSSSATSMMTKAFLTTAVAAPLAGSVLGYNLIL